MKVISALPDDKVGLWERHPAHPDGEVFVVGDRVVEVALTNNVRKALKEGRLVEVEETDAPESDALQSGATVDDVLAAVEAGDVTAEEALAWEQARSNPRVTLVEALEAQLEDADETDADADDSEEPNGDPE